jgi:toxin YoeB
MHKRIVFDGNGFEEYLHWQNCDRKMLKRINQLLKDIDRNGNEGIGKPEPLKYELQGFWSRRIDDEHRLIYKIDGDEIHIIHCRYHYYN